MIRRVGSMLATGAAQLGDRPETPDAVIILRLGLFRTLLLVHLSVETWALVIKPPTAPWVAPSAVALMCGAVLLTVCACLALTPAARVATWAAIPAYACLFSQTWPWTPNHIFLAGVCLLLIALLRPAHPDEGAWQLKSLRWVTVVVFFYAGLQKIFYGYWFGGEYLACMISYGHVNWRHVFGWMLPAAELERLTMLGQLPGAGPFRIASLPVLVISNGIYVLEMLLATLLAARRTRSITAVCVIVATFLLQAAPREFMFALLYTNLLLLFLPMSPTWGRRLRLILPPLYLAVYAALLLALLEDSPLRFLLKPNGHI